MPTHSPFPGMDPWLEGYWSPVHHRLITTFANQIQEQLPSDLFAEIEVSFYILDESEQGAGKVIPDVGVTDLSPDGSNETAGRYSNAAVATPYRIKIPADPIEEGHVEVRSMKEDRALVTPVPALAPADIARAMQQINA